jgi:hypothetical protein
MSPSLAAWLQTLLDVILLTMEDPRAGKRRKAPNAPPGNSTWRELPRLRELPDGASPPPYRA